MTDSTPAYPLATAAVSFIDPQNNNNLAIHVFATDGYNVTQRYITGTSGGWQTGPLNVPGSHVSATSWTAGGGVQIRVYATINDATTEWCFGPGQPSWTKGSYSPA